MPSSKNGFKILTLLDVINSSKIFSLALRKMKNSTFRSKKAATEGRKNSQILIGSNGR